MTNQSGCLMFSELTEFQKQLMEDANYIFPEDYKAFLKKEARKLLAVEKKIAKKDVGTSKDSKKNWEEKKSYLKKFKVGKIYEHKNSDCIRAYNSARHAHLIEHGHHQVARGESRGKNKGGIRRSGKGGPSIGWTSGQYILARAQYEFMDEFSADCEIFLFEHFKNAKGTRI